MQDDYALVSFCAGIYAVVFMLLLVVSVGDEANRLNVQAWFSWHAVLLVVLVSDPPRQMGGAALSASARRWHAFVRQVMLLVAALQSLGFAIWAIVEWTRAPAAAPGDDLILQPANFYGLATAALFVQAAVGLVAFYTMLGIYSSRR